MRLVATSLIPLKYFNPVSILLTKSEGSKRLLKRVTPEEVLCLLLLHSLQFLSVSV